MGESEQLLSDVTGGEWSCCRSAMAPLSEYGSVIPPNRMWTPASCRDLNLLSRPTSARVRIPRLIAARAMWLPTNPVAPVINSKCSSVQFNDLLPLMLHTSDSAQDGSWPGCRQLASRVDRPDVGRSLRDGPRVWEYEGLSGSESQSDALNTFASEVQTENSPEFDRRARIVPHLFGSQRDD